MKVVHYLKRAATMPPHRAAIKAGRLMLRRFDAAHQRTRDSVRSTFADRQQLPAGDLLQLFPALDVRLLEPDSEVIRVVADLVLDHRFDLLGSGWTRVAHGIPCRGLGGHVYPAGTSVAADAAGLWLNERINRANLREARQVWQHVDAGYCPIDWQLDFKSGCRWSEQHGSRTLTEGVLPGSDVKVPWELARMQHLPQLVWAWMLTRNSAPPHGVPDVYVREFRNQVLDFISTNPPRFGVNWMCTMDVAIRVANWLAAYDLFRAQGAEFDGPFVDIFTRSIYEHASHIVNNLEWSDRLRSNHYLADVTGLLFAAAYLPSSPQTDAWLDFAVREFLWESQHQFRADGSNFEASTAYHRLSAEMVAYGTAVILSHSEQRIARALDQAGSLQFHPGFQPPRPTGGRYHSVIPDDHFQRLQRMAAFTQAATGPDGRIVQFGDNDSGRFLKIRPEYLDGHDSALLVEDHLNHQHLTAAIGGMLRSGHPDHVARRQRWEHQVVSGLCRPWSPAGQISAEDDCQRQNTFPDFGLYRLVAGEHQVLFRCGPVGQLGNGGHAHNDQLSFVCAVADRPLVVDPGTYLYTPLPEERNRFRSTSMHNTVSLAGQEQNRWCRGRQGLFALERTGRQRVISHSDRHVEAEHAFAAVHCRRRIQVTSQGLIGIDHCSSADQKCISFHLAPEAAVVSMDAERGVRVRLGDRHVMFRSEHGRWSTVSSDYSRGYGEKQPTTCCRLMSSASMIEWRIVLED